MLLLPFAENGKTMSRDPLFMQMCLCLSAACVFVRAFQVYVCCLCVCVHTCEIAEKERECVSM